jgi:SAM-dependent methyltransferase
MTASVIRFDARSLEKLMSQPKCLFCETELQHSFADLGMSPLANSFLDDEQAQQMEPFYPLHARVCHECFLVQLEVFETPENIFSDYAYFSSYSQTWLDHAKEYVDQVTERFGLGKDSLVVEVASNDGYLLQNFIPKGIPILGIEPAKNVAEVAREKGIPTITEFFGESLARELAEQGKYADLMNGTNVLAQVPDINDFAEGFRILLKPDGVLTLEFPHLLRLVDENQFDTIYHEHFFYFSLLAIEKIFASHGLRVFDVQQLPTFGGSLRVFFCHESSQRSVEPAVEVVRELETDAGYDRVETYSTFDEVVKSTKRNILDFLISAKNEGKSIVAYGAPAKGNTLLNFCGIGKDFFDYAVDKSPHKQNRCLPGVHVPVYDPDRIRETKPDYVVILVWNIKEEIIAQYPDIGDWGGKFVVLIPEVKVI